MSTEPAQSPVDTPPFRYTGELAQSIETSWQQRWAERGTYNAPNPVGPLDEGFDRVAIRGHAYIMDMFPYPSGAGLHVGHPLGYIGTDVYARYRRMTGDNVLHTMGFDAFGLPAEQYAIETGQHPRTTTNANIEAFLIQLRRLGLGHDERRRFATTDPEYYKWTQWIFLQIFNAWYDQALDRARPIAELIAELDAGRGAGRGDQSVRPAVGGSVRDREAPGGRQPPAGLPPGRAGQLGARSGHGVVQRGGHLRRA